MRGQIKIQEMAFVLVALMVFFGIIAVLYLSVQGSLLSQKAREQSDERAIHAVRVLAATPEFTWSECPECVDLDKVFVIKKQLSRNASLRGLWDYDYLVLEQLYPAQAGGECTPASYPACNRTTVLAPSGAYGVASSSFVTLCRWDPGQQRVCSLGRLSISDRGRERAT